jgi:hypothetical protein
MAFQRIGRPVSSLRDGKNINLALSNIFETGLLCEESAVSGKSMRKERFASIRQAPDGKIFALRPLLFGPGRELRTSETGDSLLGALVRTTLPRESRPRFWLPLRISAIHLRDELQRGTQGQTFCQLCIRFSVNEVM